MATQIFFYVHPILRGNDSIWRAYFSNGLKPPIRLPFPKLRANLLQAMMVGRRLFPFIFGIHGPFLRGELLNFGRVCVYLNQAWTKTRVDASIFDQMRCRQCPRKRCRAPNLASGSRTVKSKLISKKSLSWSNLWCDNSDTSWHFVTFLLHKALLYQGFLCVVNMSFIVFWRILQAS